uniref:Uncharacterized protein n=1 Tax=Escherichia coli TaxID=562 RepID=A0A7G9AA19_ECOLX|nr:hypothetical protein [Escherichia coli]
MYKIQVIRQLVEGHPDFFFSYSGLIFKKYRTESDSFGKR